MKLATALALLSFVSFPLAAPAGDPPAAADLIAMARALRGDDQQITKASVIVTLKSSNPLYKAEVRLQKPDRLTVIVCDAVDDFPLMIAADGKVILYDGAHAQALFFGAWPRFVFRDDGTRTAVDFGVTVGATASSAIDRVLIDLPSITRKFDRNKSARAQDAGGFLVTCENERGSRCEMLIDPRLSTPCRSIRLTAAGESVPTMTVEIRADVKETLPPMTLPDVGKLKERLAVTAVRSTQDPAFLQGMLHLLEQSIAVHRDLTRKAAGGQEPKIESDLRRLVNDLKGDQDGKAPPHGQ